MCRNIRTLHNFEPPATDEEVRAAALQYVRKIAGTRDPSQANREAFDQAGPTFPAETFKALVKHPLTDKGLDAFVSDWAKTGQSIL